MKYDCTGNEIKMFDEVFGIIGYDSEMPHLMIVDKSPPNSAYCLPIKETPEKSKEYFFSNDNVTSQLRFYNSRSLLLKSNVSCDRNIVVGDLVVYSNYQSYFTVGIVLRIMNSNIARVLINTYTEDYNIADLVKIKKLGSDSKTLMDKQLTNYEKDTL